MKNYKFEIIPEKDKSIGTFLFQGDLNIENINEIYEKTTRNYTEFNTINIKVENVSDIDLTFIQLIYSLYKSLKTQKKYLNFRINLPDNLHELLANTGFNKYVEEIKK